MRQGKCDGRLLIGLLIINLCNPAQASQGEATEKISDGKSTISQQKVKEELLALPRDIRSGMSGRQMSTYIETLLTDLRIAEAAKKEGFIDQPEVKMRIEKAIRDSIVRSYVSAKTEEIARNLPDMQALAMERYMASPSTYTIPESVRASHILFNDEMGSISAKERADKAFEQISGGEDFAKIAALESDDISSKKRGGELAGWSEKGKLVPEFENIAFSLKPGEVSRPFRSKFGYHIIKLHEVRPPRLQPFDEVKDGIIIKLKEELVADRRADWMNQFLGLNPVEIDEKTFSNMTER